MKNALSKKKVTSEKITVKPLQTIIYQENKSEISINHNNEYKMQFIYPTSPEIFKNYEIIFKSLLELGDLLDKEMIEFVITLNQNKNIEFIKNDQIKLSKRLNEIIKFTETKIKENDVLQYKYIQIYKNKIWYGNQTIFFYEALPVEDQKNFDPDKPTSFRFLDKIDFSKTCGLRDLKELLQIEKQKNIKPFKFHYFKNLFILVCVDCNVSKDGN
jgi:hypothetical protein